MAWTTGLQLVKTVGRGRARLGAGRPGARALESFLAPWAALLTVHATVFGSLKHGVQQVAATFLGVLLAFVAGRSSASARCPSASRCSSAWPPGPCGGCGAETTAAATALIVLTTGYEDETGLLAERLLDTGIGVAVGLLVNLVFWAPLRDRAAAHRVGLLDDEIGALLERVADDLEHERSSEAADRWVERTHQLDDAVGQAGGVLGQARESGKLNPRPAAPGRCARPPASTRCSPAWRRRSRTPAA